jgi:hypothetical protein
MDSADRAFIGRVMALAVLVAAIGMWPACTGDGGGNDGGQDSGQDGGQDSGSDGGGNDGGGDAGGDAGQDAGQIVPALAAQDQTLSLATDLTINSVTAAAPGWVVVSAALGDGGTATGSASVAPGTSTGLHVAVSDPLADGATVSAELHLDLGTLGTYEPGTDPLVTGDGGVPVAASFHVTVPAGTPAVRYTFVPAFGGIGFVWHVTAAPSLFASTLSSTGDDPTLTLYSGWRYEAVDQSFTGHPFELATGGTPDTVLLSQRADGGTLKDDPTIGWEDGQSTGGVSRFTVSPSLQAQLNLYRCGVHFGTMRAPITIQSR